MLVARSVSTAAAAAARGRTLAPLRRPLAAGAPAAPRLGQSAPRRLVMVRAEGEDFDALLNKMAEKFEKAENKPVVIGYIAAAVFAFFTAEWFIHLPALDVLLGFPVQLVGLLALPYLGVRWFVDGGDAGKDVEAAVGTIVSKLPGLEKK